MGTLTSWNPLGHSRPVTGLLYLYSEEISEVWLHVFSNSVLDGVSGQFHTPATLMPGKELLVPIGYGAA